MNLLFLVDHYYPNPLTNGFCVEKIANELSINNKIYVLCYKGINEKKEYINNDIKIFKVRPRLFFKLREYGETKKNKLYGKFILKFANVIQKIKRCIFIFWSPLTSPIFIIRMYFKAKKICKMYKIDSVISTYKPLEPLIVGILLKKHNIVKYNISYVLDTFTNARVNKKLIDKFFSYTGWKWEKKAYEYSDMIINMRCYDKCFENDRYNKYRSKIYFSDIPYIVDESENNLRYNKLKFLYAGTLEKKIRNPEKTCMIISECLKNEEYEFDFYCRGDSDDIINKYSRITSNKIRNKGFVSKDVLNKALDESIIITIGNKNSKMISSKIFEFISKNKKIIHFYSDKNDSAILYLNKYPNCLLIDENNNLNKNIEKIKKFIELDIKKIDFVKLKELYIENTPEYTAKLIMNFLIESK